MDLYDVVIIGAGPAGCQCARFLAKSGHKVLLVEKVSDFSKNNFSSAGTVMEIMKDYNLPKTVVGTYWNHFKIIGEKVSRTWSSKSDMGVVFDYKKLREFLTEDAKQSGNCDVLFGTIFVSLAQLDSYSEITLQTKKDIKKVRCKVIVDATGPARAVIYYDSQKPEYIADTGIEYVIKNKDVSHPISETTLQFFLGSVWQPHGYAWIFPMGSNIFKIGVGVYDSKHQKIKPLKYYVDNIIQNYLRLNSFEVIEIHGSTLLVTPDHNERFYYKNIIAIGDAISCVNSLGGEGIRHGMYSANIATETIHEYLVGTVSNFSLYEQKMKKYFGLRWRFSYMYSKFFYQSFSDSFIDKIISALSYLNIQEIIDIFFYYKFLLMFKTIQRKIFRKKKFATSG